MKSHVNTLSIRYRYKNLIHIRNNKAISRARHIECCFLSILQYTVLDIQFRSVNYLIVAVICKNIEQKKVVLMVAFKPKAVQNSSKGQ